MFWHQRHPETLIEICHFGKIILPGAKATGGETHLVVVLVRFSSFSLLSFTVEFFTLDPIWRFPRLLKWSLTRCISNMAVALAMVSLANDRGEWKRRDEMMKMHGNAKCSTASLGLWMTLVLQIISSWGCSAHDVAPSRMMILKVWYIKGTVL